MGYVVIDFGTSSCRASFVSDEGCIEAFRQRPCAPKVSGAKAEMELDEIWGIASSVLSDLMEEVDSSAVSMVGVSALFGYCFLDGHNNPIAPAQIWMDSRAASEAAELQTLFGNEETFARFGRRVTPELLAPRLLWMKRNEPEKAKTIHLVYGIKDEIVRQLTGTIATDVAHLDYSLLWNGRKRSMDTDMAAASGVPLTRLPSGHLAHQVIGKVTPEAARRTGLSQGTPVIAGTSDGTAAMYGGGILRTGHGAMVSGTTDVLMALSPVFPEDPTGTLSVNTGMVANTFAVGGSTGISGGALMHAAGLLDGSMDELMLKVESLPAGADGLLALPGLTGERAPYWMPHATGGFLGFSLAHKGEHILKATMEACCYRIKRLLLTLNQSGVTPETIQMVGGGARNGVWNQIRADILGMPVIRLSEVEASTSGIALFCRMADQGKVDDTITWNPGEETYSPNPQNTQHYEALFEMFEGVLKSSGLDSKTPKEIRP